MEALRCCYDRLEEEPKQLLVLRYGSQKKGALAKAAKSRGTSIDAVYKKLERIRLLLRECVTKKVHWP
jgi:DNA-directed RNA polymerase specialized sigma24 family protein